jgi:competence protein ComEA
MPRKHFAHYLYFTSKDRRGSLFLLVVIIIICLLPFAYPLFSDDAITEDNIYEEELAELKSQKKTSQGKSFGDNDDDEKRPYEPHSSKNYHADRKGTLFYFDPNTITAEGWKKLGLRDKTIATIENYRSKGGKFREPADIKKIWGLFPDEAERLIPYVRIAANPSQVNYIKSSSAAEAPRYPERSRTPGLVDINASDTAAWIALPGIGSKLSQRIINFRNRLGGFYKIEQVGETFGLPDSVYQKIKPYLKVSEVLTKINLNKATLEDLKAHPYINYQLANAIVQYRKQHGDFKSVEELRKIMIIDELVFEKIAPYLES